MSSFPAFLLQHTKLLLAHDTCNSSVANMSSLVQVTYSTFMIHKINNMKCCSHTLTLSFDHEKHSWCTQHQNTTERRVFTRGLILFKFVWLLGCRNIYTDDVRVIVGSLRIFLHSCTNILTDHMGRKLKPNRTT